MKANLPYNDFKGTVAADISDFLGVNSSNDLEAIGKYFNLNQDHYKIIGLSIYGTQHFRISLVCIDRQKSTQVKEHVVLMSIPIENEKEILNVLFKDLQIVLYSKFDNKYPDISYDEEITFSNCHKTECKK